MPPVPKTFQHACFISYKHPPKTAPAKHQYTEFVEAFRDRLEFYLTTELRSYWDDQLEPGESYPPQLSRALCGSICMVAILTPEYVDSKWCLAEWDTMQDLETKRLREEKALIIPVVARGEPRDWEEHFKRRPIDLRVHVPKTQLLGVRNSAKIQAIAEKIASLIKQVSEPCADCESFEIDVGPDDSLDQPNMRTKSALNWD